MRSLSLFFILAFLSTLTASAQNTRPLFDDTNVEARQPSEPFLDRAAAPEMARLTARPRANRIVEHLQHDADVETLQRPIPIHPHTGSLTVVGKIVVDGATTLRLQITGAARGSLLWVAGDGDEHFESFEPVDATSWAPTTHGATVYIATERFDAPLTIAKLAIGTAAANSSVTSCIKDVACTTSSATSNIPAELADASRAIALLRFVRGDASYVCSGGLVNDANGSGTPYLLTAQHCIATPEEAASIEAVWDDRTTACGGAASDSVRTYGAQLLVASASTDVALLRMNRIPPHRVFLGVDRAPLAEGTATYRVSHADGGAQSYSASVVRIAGAGCSSAPRPQFIYSAPIDGAVTNGSSGAPLLLPGLRIAGQLLGLCGPSPTNACATYNDTVDGSIAASWPLLAPFLDASPPTARMRTARH